MWRMIRPPTLTLKEAVMVLKKGEALASLKPIYMLEAPESGACNNCLQSLEAVVVHLAMTSAEHVAPFADATALKLPEARGSKREGVDGCF